MAELKPIVLGDGLLGKELVRQTGWDYISRRKDSFQVDNFVVFHEKLSRYNVIINCIANTDTYSGDRDSHWRANYVFVEKLIKFCNLTNIKLVQISTDYLYTGSVEDASEDDVPVHCNTWYGYTKLLSDGLVQLQSDQYLLIRCSHKPKPFPYFKAWNDISGNFDYVDVISDKIIKLIKNNAVGIFNVGTENKTMFDLAYRTNKNVESINSPTFTPKNITMNVSKMTQSTKGPFFSIAIPAYGYNGKGKDFLEHSFKILYLQKFKNFEVVISDHSIDDTIKNLCDLWGNYLDIKYFRNEVGRGVISPNLNNALKNCTGEWIKILFQDDFLFDGDTLLKIKEFIGQNPDMMWMASSFWHTTDGIHIHRRITPSWPKDPIWQGHNSIGCPSAITIKNEDLIFFDEELNWLMDCDFYYRMEKKHGKPLFLDVDTMVNRYSEDRLSNTIPMEQRLNEYNKLRDSYE